MKRIALGLEYDGVPFRGWQMQRTLPTVQTTLEGALSTVANESITTVCAGRTDAGVHATYQVVHFDTNADRLERSWVLGVNALLPDTVRVLWSREVDLNFDARRSALARSYRYVIYNHPLRPSLLRDYVAWYYRKLNVEAMRQAAGYWIGEHDFSSFRSAECQSHSPVRCLHSIKIVRVENQVILEFKGNAFLHHMVRNMVGVLVEIGQGLAEGVWAKEVLEGRDRCLAGATAPASGLYLVDVEYPKHFGLPKESIGPWFLKMSEESLLV